MVSNLKGPFFFILCSLNTLLLLKFFFSWHFTDKIFKPWLFSNQIKAILEWVKFRFMYLYDPQNPDIIKRSWSRRKILDLGNLNNITQASAVMQKEGKVVGNKNKHDNYRYELHTVLHLLYNDTDTISTHKCS